MTGRATPLFLLLSLFTLLGLLTASTDHHPREVQWRDVHRHHHRHSKPRPKHPHVPAEEQFSEAYRSYLRSHYGVRENELDGLPWFFHLIPHFPWHFPFPWPPITIPPPPVVPVPPPPPPPPPRLKPVSFTSDDVDRINLALNVQYLQAEVFLHAALGHGLDEFNPRLAKGGPPPVGGRKARLTPRVEHVAKELGFQSVGHIRAIHHKLKEKSISRPLLNISQGVWSELVTSAFKEKPLSPSFDPFANDVNFLLAAYFVPYVGLNTLVDSSHRVTGTEARKLVSGLLGVQAAQDGVIRTLLFEVMEDKVAPYNITVAEFTSRVSNLRHRLDHTRKADEGLFVHLRHGAEKQITGNVISANDDSLSISRSPQQVLQILYGSGNASQPGSFFPAGAKGRIAKSFLY